MIYIKMGGRLGNQMFQYAFAKVLQKHNPQEKIVFNFDAVYRGQKFPCDGFENSLRYFHTLGTEVNDDINYSIPQYIIWKIYNRFYPRGNSFKLRDKYERRWLRILQFFGMYYLSLGDYPFRLKKPWWVKNLIVKGFFETNRYASEIKAELQKNFQPLQPLLPENQKLMDVIRHRNSVCISIRRGDFVDDPNNKNVYFVCDRQYFQNAIQKIKEKVQDPVFILFSNDIEWAKQNVKIDGECFYESGKDPVWETFRLMSSCKHFIISNSTLHWWAQYLSPNPDKVVIAPNRWYRTDFQSALFQSNWLLQEV